MNNVDAIQKYRSLPINEKGIAMLKSKVPQYVKFHTWVHADEVLRDALSLAIEDGISDGKDLELLSIAACYHDSGYINGPPAGHEDRSCELVTHAMRLGGYSSEDIATVKELILATKIHMVDGVLTQLEVSNRLARYLQDGDVANFGKTDYFDKRKLVEQDLEPSDRDMFLAESLEFLKKHRWKTAVALGRFSEQQKRNIQDYYNVLR